MKTSFVLPFVDCDDKKWRESYDIAYKNYYNLPNVRVMSERFKEFGYLRYLFRGVAFCYPWIDETVLILAQPSQLPKWVNTDTVKVVYHKDIIPKKYLPTFNSCTIEMFLPQLPIDSDYILYANDDFYPIRPLDFSDYFTEEGYPKLKYLIRKNSNLWMFADTCREMWENCCKLHNVATDSDTFKQPNHDIQPINVKMMHEAADMYESFMYSHLEQFREKHQNNQYIYANYARLTGKYEKSQRDFKYTSTSNNTVDEVSDIIRNRKHDMLVLNDGGLNHDIWVRNPQIIDAFESIFPEKCKYEK